MSQKTTCGSIRKSNLVIRPFRWFIRLVLSIVVIPLAISCAIMSATIFTGSKVDEAWKLFKDLSVTVYTTATAHYQTATTGIQVLFNLQGAPQEEELGAYILETYAQADKASAALKEALATAIKNNKKNRNRPITITDILTGAAIGFCVPFILAFIVNFYLTRRWLRYRDRETVARQQQPC